MRLKNFRLGDIDMAARNAHAFAQGSAEDQMIGKARLVAIGDAVNDQARKPADLRRVEIVSAHEYFDAAQAAFSFKAEGVGNLLLMLESQLVLMLTGGEMKLVSHPKKEVL